MSSMRRRSGAKASGRFSFRDLARFSTYAAASKDDLCAYKFLTCGFVKLHSASSAQGAADASSHGKIFNLCAHKLKILPHRGVSTAEVAPARSARGRGTPARRSKRSRAVFRRGCARPLEHSAQTSPEHVSRHGFAPRTIAWTRGSSAGAKCLGGAVRANGMPGAGAGRTGAYGRATPQEKRRARRGRSHGCAWRVRQAGVRTRRTARSERQRRASR